MMSDVLLLCKDNESKENVGNKKKEEEQKMGKEVKDENRGAAETQPHACCVVYGRDLSFS